MKKRFASILALVIALVPLLNYTATATEYESTYELSPGKIFSSGTSYGENLYDYIYQRARNEGKDVAIVHAIAKTGLSRDEMAQWVAGYYIGAAMGTQGPNGKMTAKEIQQKTADVQDIYNTEKEIADLQADAKLEVEQTEIFANGDESDSGFDLLVDLDIIYAILFGKGEMVLSNPAGARPGNREVEANVVGMAAAGAGGAAGAAGAAAGAVGAAAQAAAGAVAGAVVGLIPSAQQEIPGEAAVMCPLDQAFNNAVAAARERDRRQTAQAGAGGNAGAGQGAGGNVGADGNAGAGGAAGNGGGAAQENVPVAAEPAANWKRPLPCDGVFCLKIDTVYKTDSSYLPSDNCIACHFEKINDAFKKTLDHNLVPSKVTGNLLEAPKCKRSLLNLKQNIILIPTPIITPPNDDVIVKGDFLKNIMDAFEKYYSNPGRCNSGVVGGACKPDPDIQAEAAARALANAAKSATQNEILLQIQNIVASKKTEAAKMMAEARISSDAQNQAMQFQVLMDEINTMNSYFNGFLKVYQELVSDRPDFPCNTLLNKPTCS